MYIVYEKKDNGTEYILGNYYYESDAEQAAMVLSWSGIKAYWRKED